MSRAIILAARSAGVRVRIRRASRSAAVDRARTPDRCGRGRPHSAKGIVMDFIHSDDAPKAIGPYSQAVKAGNVIYTSGQVSLDPNTGELVTCDFASQARRVFDNLRAVLQA